MATSPASPERQADPPAAAGPDPAPAAGAPDLLPEERLCAGLLAAMVLMMFLQAVARNAGPVARSSFGLWIAHATEVLPSGLTWLTFLGCSAVTRRRGFLRVEILTSRLGPAGRARLEWLAWGLWGAFFAVLLGLGTWASWTQRRQMTSIGWLPAWVVSLSVPLGAVLVLWRNAQVARDLRRGRAAAPGADPPDRAGTGGDAWIP